MATKGRVADIRNKFLARIAATPSNSGSTMTTNNGVDQKQFTLQQHQQNRRPAAQHQTQSHRAAPSTGGALPAVIERTSSSVVATVAVSRDSSQRVKQSSCSQVAEVPQVKDVRSASSHRSNPQVEARTAFGATPVRACGRTSGTGNTTATVNGNGWHHNGDLPISNGIQGKQKKYFVDDLSWLLVMEYVCTCVLA